MGAMEPVNSDNVLVLETHSSQRTHQLGHALGQVLAPGDFVGLIGTLGAGKTHFVRGVAEGAGVDSQEVASPTFAIVYAYEGRLPVLHADLYRLETYDELYATGFDDWLTQGAAVLVEWVDKIPGAIIDDALLISFRANGEYSRELSVRATGKQSAALLARWKTAIP